MLNAILLGKQLRTARKNLGWSQENVAAEIGSSTARISRLESGAADVSLRDLARLCALYQIQPAVVVAASEGEGTGIGALLAALRNQHEQTYGQEYGLAGLMDWILGSSLPPGDIRSLRDWYAARASALEAWISAAEPEADQ